MQRSGYGKWETNRNTSEMVILRLNLERPYLRRNRYFNSLKFNHVDKQFVMIIEISDNIMEKAGLSPEKIQLRLAILLFEEEILTLGQASEMAGLHQIMFQKELAKRKISIHYGEDDFEKDWQTIKQL